VLAVALTAAACSDDDGGDPDGLSAEPFRLGLEVGECFDRPADPDVTSVSAVPCRQAHDLEVIAVFTLDAGEYPGRPAVAQAAGEGCQERFADYVGTDHDSSGLVLVPYVPDRLAWEQGEREVTCAVSRPDGQLEGTVQDSETPA
jgi:Septum formation